MNVSEEIHAIKNQIINLTNSVNSLVKSLGNVKVIENQQMNDKETVNSLIADIDKLADAITTLNTNIATMNGINKGKRMIWTIFGSLICVSLIGIVTTVILHNSEIAVLHNEVKTLQDDIVILKKKKA